MHVMIDLETLSLKPNAVILSFGAVRFDEHGTYEELYAPGAPDFVQEQIDAGRRVDAGTLKWWFEQSDEARGAVFKGTYDGARPLDFILDTPNLEGVWGNGASFDNVVLRSLLEQNELKIWSYKLDRCFRTLKALYAPDVVLNNNHNALDDARNQAQLASRILRGIRNQAATD